MSSKHHRTFKNLKRTTQKNLVVAFTHIGEWTNSIITSQIEDFIEMVRFREPKKNTKAFGNFFMSKKSILREKSLELIDNVRGFYQNEELGQFADRNQEKTPHLNVVILIVVFYDTPKVTFPEDNLFTDSSEEESTGSPKQLCEEQKSCRSMIEEIQAPSTLHPNMEWLKKVSEDKNIPIAVIDVEEDATEIPTEEIENFINLSKKWPRRWCFQKIC